MKNGPFGKYITYEGEFLNGEKGGHGKLFDDMGRFIYEGEFLNDRKKWNRQRI